MKLSETTKNMGYILRQVGSIFALPAIPLYLLSYHLMRKRCTYHWGNFDVTPLEPLRRNEYLFTRIFPSAIVVLGIGLIVTIGYWLGLPIR